MPHTDVIIIGGGQAGLAMSYCLTERAIDHVVLERGRVGERWRVASWDSLRLLSPNWINRLPGLAYDGPDPDGFMMAGEFAGRLEHYAHSFGLPVETSTTVTTVESAGSHYRVVTDRGTWTAASVVIAAGVFDTPFVPDAARRLSPTIHQLSSAQYRNPGGLQDGGVLVVGASASGIQLAQEIHRSGRPVTMAVGSHRRLPRRYRGHDILWWLDRIGVLDERADDVADLAVARRQPSLQLVGDASNRTIDLGTLRSEGVRLVGRLAAIDGTRASFAGDLAQITRDAHQRLEELIARIDAFAERQAGCGNPAAERVHALIVESEPMSLDLDRAGIRTVLWATGFRCRYPWLKLPVLDERGEIIHRGGITDVPGIYVLGLRFLRRRKSSFIDGSGPDARELADDIVATLRTRRRTAA